MFSFFVSRAGANNGPRFFRKCTSVFLALLFRERSSPGSCFLIPEMKGGSSEFNGDELLRDFDNDAKFNIRDVIGISRKRSRVMYIIYSL